MAADEAILSHYSSQKIPTLRIYGWEKPFVSLGYHQNASEVLTSLGTIPFVRRITGGSAILHDKEITYSLVCSLADLKLEGGVKESYRKLCAFLKDFYSQLGINAKFVAKEVPNCVSQYGNLCFSSWQHYDFIVKGKKIGGNAQRRRKDIIFQHGSIPQDIDFDLISSVMNAAEDVKGKATSLNDILGKETDFSKLQDLLASSFKTCFDTEFQIERLSEGEQNTIEYLLKNKYKNETWNLRNEKTCLAQ